MDSKESEEDKNKIALMTVHSSKGLEFPNVYIIGMEENLFPAQSRGGDSEQESEEERRLFYVALTRAENSVKLSFAKSRMRWGTNVNNSPSRFIKEIDKVYISNPLTNFEDEIKTNFVNRNSNFGNKNTESTNFKPRQNTVSQPQFTKQTAMKAPNPNFVADHPSKLAAGQNIEHERFGLGKIITIEGDPTNLKAVVDFANGGRKTLLLKFAKIRIIN